MKKGFTLVELIVAIGLFSVIITIAIGGFVTALRTQRQVTGIIATQSNASLALEQMMREIRTGYLFCHDVPIPPDTQGVPTCSCTANGPVWTCNDLNFRNGMGANVIYSLVNGTIERADDRSSSTPITATNVVVNNLTFTLFGNIENDHWNPRVTIAASVSPNSRDPGVASTTFNIQTTVSARQIDCLVTGGTASC